jgi:hypothetical protein
LTTADTDGKRTWKPRGIVLPWRVDGNVWQLKIRRADGRHPKYTAIKGGHPLIFGAHTLAGHPVAVLTEGEFDAMLVHQEAGDLVGVATLGSASKSLSTRAVDYLLPITTLLAAYDMDAEGERGAARLSGLSARVRRVRLPSGKDITELWTRGGSVRAWVEYEIERLRVHTTAAIASAAKTLPVSAPSRDSTHQGLPIRYPFDVRWAQERGWLKVRDPFDGKWHEVRARDCPLHWVSMARAEKEQRQWAA